MAGGIDWFRWHHGSVTDPKFALVARKAGASLPDVLAVWAYLLESASAAAERGHYGEIDTEALDCLFGFPNTETRSADVLASLGQRGLLRDGAVVAWLKRQPKRERDADNSTERVQAFRQRERHETPRNSNESQETPRGEERREEEKTEPIGSVVCAAKPRPTKKCPASFAPTEPQAWIDASCPGVDWQFETAKFRDHTFRNPIGDWNGAWRNWMRNAAQMTPRSDAMTFRERDAANAAARVREMTGGLVSAKPVGRVVDALSEVFDAAPRRLG